MLLGQILRIWERSVARRALAVMVSAVAAFLVTIATTPLVQVPMAAGIAQIGLMQEEHILVTDYVSSRAEADRQAILAEIRERDDLRAAAVPVSVAAAIPLPKSARPVRLAAAKANVAADSLPPVHMSAPVQLQSAALPQRPQSGQKGTRSVFATVERVPRWAWAAVQNVADWAIVAPVQTIARLPERRLL